MAETPVRMMTVGEFLQWDPPGDIRCELVRGAPLAMAPPAAAHGTVVMQLGAHVSLALRARKPCRIQAEAGILLPWLSDTYYVADLAVTCRPHEPGQQELPDPLLIIEVLSPSTENHDRKVKLPDYRLLPGVQEIVLVDSVRMFCEVHRRFDGERWLTEFLRAPEARLVLDSVGLDLPLSEIYADIALEA